MSARRWTTALAGALATASLLTAAAWAGCGPRGYTYAGFQAQTAAHGVGAALTMLAAPQVEGGHIAGWVGVGGIGEGPGGTTEWIQVGYSGFPGSFTNQLYYEVTLPHRDPKYVPVGKPVVAGERHRVAVLEMRSHPNWWKVWVDGRAVSVAMNLPGSHGRWRPVATAESWDGGAPVCNRYSYFFDRVSVATVPGGGWERLRDGLKLEDQGYQVQQRAPAAFVATTSA